MTNAKTKCIPTEAEMRMELRYGFNETDNWWHFALGRRREHIWRRLQEMDTRIMRIFLFDKHAPDPVAEWDLFAAYVQAVLNVGATPMITFAKFDEPYDDPRALRRFAGRCADVVWGCIEQWGGEVVRGWYWCVWNEPSNRLIGGGLSFEKYRHIYEEVAMGILRWLAPYLGERKPLIGGPAVDGFDALWMDWISRFVTEINNSLIGFVSWHRYGDWRLNGEWGAPCDEADYQTLLLGQTRDYEARARAINQLLGGREILNICGELNVHSHHEVEVSRCFNQTIFGAAYYASALLRLMWGGADVEMWWTATDETGPYGVMDKHGVPTPVFHAKKLCAQYIRYGDWVSFPTFELDGGCVDVAVARGEDGKRSALTVHLKDTVARYALSEWTDDLASCCTLLKIDRSTRNRIAKMPFDGTIAFDGYGVAVVTNVMLDELNAMQPRHTRAHAVISVT